MDFDSLAESVDCHLGRITLENLKKWKDEVHQVELSSDLIDTHEDVRIKSVRVAQGLQKRGLETGDLIVICGETHNNICLPVIASFYIGTTVFPLSTTMKINEIKRMLSFKRPKMMFCDSCMKDTFMEALQDLNFYECEVVIFDKESVKTSDSQNSKIQVTSFEEFLLPTGTENEFEVVNFDPKTTIVTISCSSGTTGLPKGVCHSHQTLALPIIFLNLLRAKDPLFTKKGFYMNFSNYYWISSIYSLLFTCISGVPRLVCAAPYSEELLVKGLTEYKPPMLFLSPVSVNNLLKSNIFNDLDLSSLNSFAVGGSATSEEAIKTLGKKLTNGKVYNGYGATEVGNISSSQGDGTLGQIAPWLKWKIVDDETKEEVNNGEVGELRLKGPTMFKYYLNNPEATKEAFDSEGFYRSGDLMRFDDQGNLHFIDRIKEVIKFRNFQISPTEVEMEIAKSPEVLLVCVVGVKHSEDGEHPMAFVQKTKESTLTEQDVMDIVKNSLADHKQLRGGVKFIDVFPMTESGKIHRKILKEMANNNLRQI